MTAHHHRRPWVRRARHVAFAVFLAVVAYLLVRAARAIDWSEVVAVLRGLDAATLATALALTAASYLLYACYDLAAVRARAVASVAASSPRSTATTSLQSMARAARTSR